jgi:hypothetical protein
MVRNPVLAILGSQMWSFDSVSQCYIQYFPQLATGNVTYGDLFRYFPDGTVAVSPSCLIDKLAAQ